MSLSAQDSLSYFTAEDRYLKGDCPGAIQGFEGYAARFPQGAFLVQARFYQAECELRNNQEESALSNYLYVLERPSSQFTENALERVAAIRFESGNFPEALLLNISKELEFLKLHPLKEIKISLDLLK